ncbi:MAG TPA: hypothetical protein VGX16_00175 [Solirubrobacteraceae bacterium]|jgi:hypothetical protein|nr:hypothetical protein [Solirubrobacteraceae bacterium]
MSEAAHSFEGLLRQALTPVEPPEALSRRLEGTLESLTEIAAEELESWELSAMRDPRNWVRPAAAVLVGGTAGAALVLLRARRRARPAEGLADGLQSARESAERTLRDLGEEARRLIGER